MCDCLQKAERAAEASGHIIPSARHAKTGQRYPVLTAPARAPGVDPLHIVGRHCPWCGKSYSPNP